MDQFVADLILRIILVQLAEGHRLSIMGDASDWLPSIFSSCVEVIHHIPTISVSRLKSNNDTRQS